VNPLGATLLGVGAVALGVASAVGQQARGAPGFDAEQVAKILTHSPLGPPPADPTNTWADDPRAARLGQRLFFERRFSANGEVSCATCHVPDRNFTDGESIATGLQRGERHTPTLWNAGYQRWYFWDGRADSLWAQPLQPLESAVEMGGSRAGIADLLREDPRLGAPFAELFGPLPAPDDAPGIDRAFVHVGKALAAYERRLVSRRAPFDVFVEGLREDDSDKRAALSPAAQRGLQIFIGKGRCRMCHGGPNFSDGEFHGTGIAPLGGGNLTDPARYRGIQRLLADPFNAKGAFSDERDGQAALALETLARGPETWGEFKTPTLRNVALTAPYMHQGQMATLADVVRFYSTLEGSAPPGHHQEQVLRPLGLDAGEQADLVAFLESLTDVDVDPALLVPPPD